MRAKRRKRCYPDRKLLRRLAWPVTFGLLAAGLALPGVLGADMNPAADAAILPPPAVAPGCSLSATAVAQSRELLVFPVLLVLLVVGMIFGRGADSEF